MKDILSYLHTLKEALKTAPAWLRGIITAIIAILAALLVALFMSSCSHSAMLFKGQGELEYYYNGAGSARELPTKEPIQFSK